MPQPALMPMHPAARARARMIIQQFSEKFVPNFYKLLLRSVGSLLPGPAKSAACASGSPHKIGILLPRAWPLAVNLL